MTDAPEGSVRIGRNMLGLRLALAFLAVALAAVALLAGLGVLHPRSTMTASRLHGRQVR
jgi:uncharacterized membrane protein YhaH (DUF805 family)